MNCPNCNKEMKHTFESGYFYPFSTGDEPDYPSYYEDKEYFCKECKIKCENNEWTIPREYFPTEKQIKTVKFINNELHVGIEPLTKKQCIKDIGKYFNNAKESRKENDYVMYQEMSEITDESDFF